MTFRIEKIDGKHVVIDQNGAQYGRYDNKAEAEVAVDGWIEYYREDA